MHLYTIRVSVNLILLFVEMVILVIQKIRFCNSNITRQSPAIGTLSLLCVISGCFLLQSFFYAAIFQCIVGHIGLLNYLHSVAYLEEDILILKGIPKIHKFNIDKCFLLMHITKRTVVLFVKDSLVGERSILLLGKAAMQAQKYFAKKKMPILPYKLFRGYVREPGGVLFCIGLIPLSCIGVTVYYIAKVLSTTMQTVQNNEPFVWLIFMCTASLWVFVLFYKIASHGYEHPVLYSFLIRPAYRAPRHCFTLPEE